MWNTCSMRKCNFDTDPQQDTGDQLDAYHSQNYCCALPSLCSLWMEIGGCNQSAVVVVAHKKSERREKRKRIKHGWMKSSPLRRVEGFACFSLENLLSSPLLVIWRDFSRVSTSSTAMAAMASAAGMARLLSSAPSTSAASPAARPMASFSPRQHQPLLPASTRQLGSLHLAHARNVPAERKSVAVTPAEPEMSPADLKAYEEALAKLDGTRPDFWEGPGWNLLGWTIQYMWVFGIVVSIIACITAVRTYNLGATDFKNTEVFKEAIEFQTDGAESSGLSAFDESNKEAP